MIQLKYLDRGVDAMLQHPRVALWLHVDAARAELEADSSSFSEFGINGNFVRLVRRHHFRRPPLRRQARVLQRQRGEKHVQVTLDDASW